jgi:excisionase family DNA binding protein
MSLADAPDVLTVPEAAALLRAGRNQTYDLIRRGELHAVRVGRSLRVPKAALVRFLEAEPEVTARTAPALGAGPPDDGGSGH